MSGLYYVNVSLHVLAAIVWLGGMFFVALIGAPVLRAIESPLLRAQLFRLLGMRFRAIGWAAIGVLLVTGAANLGFRGQLSWGTLGSAAFWGTRYGTTLAWKLSGVAVMVVASALHDFVLGPMAGSHDPGSPEGRRARRATAWLGRANALVGIVVVYAAVRLARGG
jgi:copper resistance protein D